MKKIVELVIIISIIVIASCKDDDVEPDYGTKAKLSGSVELFDEGNTKLSSDSMIVSILGSNPLILDTTDINGNFAFKDVKYGTYSISYSKNGYGTFTLNHVYHQKGDTEIENISQLGQFSTTKVTLLTSNVSGSSITISATTNPIGNTSKPRYIRFFFYTSDDVSNIHFSAYSNVVTAANSPYNYRVNLHKLIDQGFKSGDIIWVKAYGDALHSNDYIDLISGKHIFPNLNLHSAAAVSFIMP
jgi:hypothetical protein